MPHFLIESLALGFLGLLIGSFLNVVIYRLPVMLHRSWREESTEFLRSDGMELPNTSDECTIPAEGKAAFNLMVPRSRCQSCNHAISAWENIPILSYLILRGKCSSCKIRISPRYPLIEFVTASFFAFWGFRFGLSVEAFFWSGFSASLIALVMIDWDTTLLPDSMTLPLVWAGIIFTLLGFNSIDLNSSIWGSIAGYLSLWSVYWIFKLVTGKEGMGHGDFKLLAALGAWLGIGAIAPILLSSSLIGAIMGVMMKFRGNLREGGYMPYGPFLGGAGMFIAIFGTEWFYRFMGI